MRKRKFTKIPLFFKPVFWSYKFASIDPNRDKKRVTINTINYGKWQHWTWLFDFYGKKGLKRIIEEIPRTEFREPALKLICLLLGIEKIKYASRSDYIQSQTSPRKA
jgi:hypothetical protein